MNSRPVTAALFVVLCLALSGFVLRRQLAAHPVPAGMQEQRESAEPASSAFPERNMDQKIWHRLTGAKRQAVIASIQGQLAAFRADDGGRAASYQSRALRHNFLSDRQFTEMIRVHYPEFGHCRSAQFGSVWSDATARHAAVRVTVTGENGRQARGGYMMVWEDGLYRVAGVDGGGRISRQEEKEPEH